MFAIRSLALEANVANREGKIIASSLALYNLSHR